MKHEYHEGPRAGENFKKLAAAVFRAPKVAKPKGKSQNKRASQKRKDVATKQV